MQYWKKLSHSEQDRRITSALAQNIDYRQTLSLGIPASRLDSEVFHEGADFLQSAPLLRTYVQNPNHIGCHTLGDSERFFKGTQEIERELIEMLSVDLLHAEPGYCDGYVATGGTEANLQAMWIYRNLFLKACNGNHAQIALLCSSDTHYSIAKAANLLHLSRYEVPVAADTRAIVPEELDEVVAGAVADGIRYFIVVANMATTMFGSVDDPELYVDCLQRRGLEFRMHIDAAFGGFVYPISRPGDRSLSFFNRHVSSITLDAHKMLQAPYGTGIFLARKGLMAHVCTEEAQYVNGMDITLSGSRSGANAIAVWMILSTYGPFGYLEKINKLMYRTDWCCRELDRLGVRYFRHPQMNIITIRSAFVSGKLADRYGLVPDTHANDANWYKIVVMDHVSLDQLQDFISALEKGLTPLQADRTSFARRQLSIRAVAHLQFSSESGK